MNEDTPTPKKTARRMKPLRRERARSDGELLIKQVSERDGTGRYYAFWMVRGWRELSGKPGRRKFSTEAEARAFAALKRVETLNNRARLQEVVTELSVDAVREAEAAVRRLEEIRNAGGGDRRHTLTAAVEFYVKAMDAGEAHPVNLKHAVSRYISERELGGVRPRSLRQLESTLGQFEKFMHGAPVSAVTEADVKRYLDGLRAKSGGGRAQPKTFNGYRADLHAFFGWAVTYREPRPDGTERRWCIVNPVTGIKKKTLDRNMPHVLSVQQCRELLQYVESFKGGRMAPYFALALFAGLRTGGQGEMEKLARHPQRDSLIDLPRGVIHVRPEISKTSLYRQTLIRPALLAWLQRYGLDILPRGHDRDLKAIRAKFKLQHDALRHTFFSMHVGAFKSTGEASIEGGNTESVLKRFYLNLSGYSEAAEFWNILPATPAQPQEKTS